MKGKFVLISGTASLSCEDEKLSVALEFIQHFTRQVLQRGGGIVVLVGDEESTKDQRVCRTYSTGWHLGRLSVTLKGP